MPATPHPWTSPLQTVCRRSPYRSNGALTAILLRTGFSRRCARALVSADPRKDSKPGTVLSEVGDPNVPFVRLDDADPALSAELLSEVERVARSSAFILGSEVEEFEAEFAAYCGTGEAVGVGSGTDALELALRALGIGSGADVIVPTNSFIATAEAVVAAGATPRLVDVHPESHLLTADIVASAITRRTACIIPVHLHGRTADMEPLLTVARAAGLAVVEDACQAHGALYRGRRVGSLGDAGCFSFYPAKNLGAWGDGGAVVTDDPVLARNVRLLRSHGESPRNHHHVTGCTSRLDALQAAILRVKLRRLDGWNERRRCIARALTAALADAPVMTPPPTTEGEDHVFHHYVVLSEARDLLRARLAEHDVGTAIHYPVPIHRSEAFAERLERHLLPTAEALARRICSLPLFPSLTDDEVALVVDAVGSAAPEAVAAA
jgi:dTDP-3-amino-3,4,6-trideoxy-alpha-D-glucose transaminase